MTDLTSYGSGIGLKTWSLNPQINDLDLITAEKIVARARRWLQSFGNFDIGVASFTEMATDAIYYAAEALYFQSSKIEGIVTPFRSERIGGYAYDKGANNTNAAPLSLEQAQPILGSLIEYLMGPGGPRLRTIRLFETLPADPSTGIIDYVHSIESDRIVRWITGGFHRTPEEYRRIVYGS